MIVGDVSDGDPAYGDRLRAMAGELGIADRTTFTGFRADVPQLMRAADVLVHASIEPEPFGTAVLEGMACGRPYVAMNEGGPAEMITSGVHGLLVGPNAPEAMAEALVTLLTRPEVAGEFGRGRGPVASSGSRRRRSPGSTSTCITKSPGGRSRCRGGRGRGGETGLCAGRQGAEPPSSQSRRRGGVDSVQRLIDYGPTFCLNGYLWQGCLHAGPDSLAGGHTGHPERVPSGTRGRRIGPLNSRIRSTRRGRPCGANRRALL